MASVSYSQTKIKDLLIQEDESKTIESKICMRLYRSIEIGNWYSRSKLKTILAKTYELVGKSSIAKAIDIENYFYVSPKKKLIDNIREHGYIIVGKKFQL